jgi:prepilin-type N-terminal cleavage/methylation domain-containing protein
MGRVERHAWRTRRGFTLVEVVASLAILGAVVVGLLTLRDRATAAHAAAAQMLTCTRLCSTKAAELRAGRAFEGRGTFDAPEGYEWRIERLVPPYADMPRLAAYEVIVLPPSGDAKVSSRIVLWLRSAEAGVGL